MRRERNSPDNVSCNQGNEQFNIFGGFSTNNIQQQPRIIPINGVNYIDQTMS